jgi:hypothetical protein
MIRNWENIQGNNDQKEESTSFRHDEIKRKDRTTGNDKNVPKTGQYRHVLILHKNAQTTKCQSVMLILILQYDLSTGIKMIRQSKDKFCSPNMI